MGLYICSIFNIIIKHWRLTYLHLQNIGHQRVYSCTSDFALLNFDVYLALGNRINIQRQTNGSILITRDESQPIKREYVEEIFFCPI